MRAVVTAAVAVFAYGTVVHVVQLVVSGLDPHPTLPGSLSAYFLALTVVDPLAAGLLVQRHRGGVVVAPAVLVTDAAANACANYVLDPTARVTAGRVGQAVVAALAVVMLGSTPSLWRYSRPRQVHR